MNDTIYFISSKTGYSVGEISKLSNTEIAFILASLEVKEDVETNT